MRKFALPLSMFLGFVAIGLLLAPAATATVVACCTISSDATPASQLQATFDFQVSGSTLTLNVDNDTVAPNQFNINEIFFNASGSVTSLSLTSASHSDTSALNNFGDVTSGWAPVDTSVMVNGFGIFDFGPRSSCTALTIPNRPETRTAPLRPSRNRPLPCCARWASSAWRGRGAGSGA